MQADKEPFGCSATGACGSEVVVPVGAGEKDDLFFLLNSTGEK